MASSSSFSSSIPKLSFPLGKPIVEIVEQVSSSDFPISLRKHETNIISRSESHQPQNTPIHFESSPKKSMTTFSFSCGVNKEDRDRVIRLTQETLEVYYRAVTASKARKPGIVIVMRKIKSGLGLRNLIHCANEVKAGTMKPERVIEYQIRAKKTLWKMVETIQQYIELDQTHFTVTKKGGELKSLHVFTLIRKAMAIVSLREFANELDSQLLRQKIVKCFYKVLTGNLEMRCSDLLEVIVEIGKIPLIQGITSLRTLVAKDYLTANPDAPTTDLIIALGYEAMFKLSTPEELVKFENALICNVSELLSYDGESMDRVELFMVSYREQIAHFRNHMLSVKIREQGTFANREDLKRRVELQINCKEVTLCLERFETMFHFYIESSLILLEKYFRADFSTDLKSFRERLNAALISPYNREELSKLCSLLNYLVWNVLEKHNVCLATH